MEFGGTRIASAMTKRQIAFCRVLWDFLIYNLCDLWVIRAKRFFRVYGSDGRATRSRLISASEYCFKYLFNIIIFFVSSVHRTFLFSPIHGRSENTFPCGRLVQFTDSPGVTDFLLINPGITSLDQLVS